MTEVSSAAEVGGPAREPLAAGPRPPDSMTRRLGAWLPTWDMITTRHLEQRKRKGLMIVVVLLIAALPVLVLGIRLVFHAVDPKTYGPAGSPGIFAVVCNTMAEFGFIAAAALGTSLGTTDFTDGMFRHLVVTGRSRLALYLARIPVGLSILLPLVALAFAATSLVTSYAGSPQPASVNFNGVNIPVSLSQAQLESWLLERPVQGATAFEQGPGPGSGPGPGPSPAQARTTIKQNIGTYYGQYVSTEVTSENPPVNEMVKIGLWLELEVGVGFMVGLGLGSLLGQRTVSTVLMIVLEIIVTPILGNSAIPYFLNGQRLDVGIALDQMRPAGLAGGAGLHAPGRVIFGGRGVLNIPPMPTWAMIAVIVGWIVGWSVIGAWRMITRDA